MILQNWAVRMSGDGYTAPELSYRCLSGQVYDCPKHEDGAWIVSSRIVKIEGKTITTSTGSVYELGEVHPEYAAWVKEHTGKEIDQDTPIKFVS